jgi:hypothetical protein
MAPWVSSGHSENDRLALVSISWMTIATVQGKPPPPWAGSKGIAPKPDST